MLKEIALKYFEYWSSKNLEKISLLLDDECKLEDWTHSLDNKKDIINLNKEFFNTNDVDLKINSLVENSDKVWAHISIKINEDENLDVVDILTFKDMKITKIKAFKG